jgi:hypothetical protein
MLNIGPLVAAGTKRCKLKRAHGHANEITKYFNYIRVRSFILNGAPEKRVPRVPGLWRLNFPRGRRA